MDAQQGDVLFDAVSRTTHPSRFDTPISLSSKAHHGGFTGSRLEPDKPSWPQPLRNPTWLRPTHMQPSRRLDAILATTLALPLPLVALVAGDPLYIGVWYYLAVPAAALGLAAIFRTRPLFLVGTSLATAATFLVYMSINWRAARPEGLLALGHIFSLPGAGIGIVLGALLSARFQRPLAGFLSGLLGLALGFFSNQLVLCNTVMWCGPLSMGVR